MCAYMLFLPVATSCQVRLMTPFLGRVELKFILERLHVFTDSKKVFSSDLLVDPMSYISLHILVN